MKHDYRKFLNKGQRPQVAHVASTNDISERSVTISFDGFAKFQLHQK